MHYYEVLIADSKYRSDTALTYSHDTALKDLSTVTVPVRSSLSIGFIMNKVKKPRFATRPIKNVVSTTPLPARYIELARWISTYYGCSLGEALRLFAPPTTTLRRNKKPVSHELRDEGLQLEIESPLTSEQKNAISEVENGKATTHLVHGETGSGKTRLYVELAKKVLDAGQSVIFLTPEIALTGQLASVVQRKLGARVAVIHSQLSVAERRVIWLKALEAREPMVIIGPRSALFMPLSVLGLVVVDEAHEPAYKQDQTPRYHTVRVASRLGEITGAKVILGSATPSVVDYYLAEMRGSLIKMQNQAITGARSNIDTKVIDIKDRRNFSANPYLSDQLIKSMRATLMDKKQVILFFNRRGTARLMMCNRCGWQLLCPRCHIPLTYHSDSHLALCHICGFRHKPPLLCPECSNPDIIYKSIGTKALADSVTRLFPEHTVRRFDSDNTSGERIEELYPQLYQGKIDILIGTQLLAKGLDLPRLGLVGIIAAETSLALPDYTAEERSFQLLYQVIGRVGRGHGKGGVVLQAYDTQSLVLKSVVERDWDKFYEHTLSDRQKFGFPPFSFLLQLVCRRATLKGAMLAASNLKQKLEQLNLPVMIIGPAPSFYERRGGHYYWQLVVKSKDREHLLNVTAEVPTGWMVDLDPGDLL